MEYNYCSYLSKYLTYVYKDNKNIVAFEPLNEPWYATPIQPLKELYWDVYQLVKEKTDWISVFHDSFRLYPALWEGFMTNCPKVALDTHMFVLSPVLTISTNYSPFGLLAFLQMFAIFANFGPFLRILAIFDTSLNFCQSVRYYAWSEPYDTWRYASAACNKGRDLQKFEQLLKIPVIVGA